MSATAGELIPAALTDCAETVSSSKPEAEGVPWAEDPWEEAAAEDAGAGEERAAAGEDEAAPAGDDEAPVLPNLSAAAGLLEGVEAPGEEDEESAAAGLLTGVLPPALLVVVVVVELPLLLLLEEEEPLPLDDVLAPEPPIGPL